MRHMLDDRFVARKKCWLISEDPNLTNERNMSLEASEGVLNLKVIKSRVFENVECIRIANIPRTGYEGILRILFDL